MLHHIILESTICELVVATKIPTTYFHDPSSIAFGSVLVSRYFSNCSVAKAGATSKKLEKRIDSHWVISGPLKAQKICTQSGIVSLMTILLNLSVALSVLTTWSIAGISEFSTSFEAAYRVSMHHWKLYLDQRLTFICWSTIFPSGRKTTGRLLMEAIVAIRAIAEAIWRLVKILTIRGASPRREIQAMPTRRKHDVSLEIALLKRATGACWREVSISCNSKRSYRKSVSM
jgi:hypothetical protein